MPENNQQNRVIIDFIKQMIGKFREIRPPKPAGIKMMAPGILFNQSRNQIQFAPKRLKHIPRYFRITSDGIADVSG